MSKRITQFFSALKAKISYEDLTFIDKYLNSTEKSLFFEMDLPTQKHCLNVTKTSLLLIRKLHNNSGYANIDTNLLIKTGLLHDIGKPAGGLRTWHRVVIVVANSLLPASLLNDFSRDYNKTSKLGLKYAFFLQKNHPALGGALAKRFNLNPELIYLIKEHHSNISEKSPMELQILQKADNLN